MNLSFFLYRNEFEKQTKKKPEEKVVNRVTMQKTWPRTHTIQTHWVALVGKKNRHCSKLDVSVIMKMIYLCESVQFKDIRFKEFHTKSQVQ